MSEDIVARLRGEARYLEGDQADQAATHMRLLLRAAIEIERLRAEVERLKSGMPGEWGVKSSEEGT